MCGTEIYCVSKNDTQLQNAYDNDYFTKTKNSIAYDHDRQSDHVIDYALVI
jgi:hypothetical protein